MKNQEQVFAYRGLAYLLLLVVLGSFSSLTLESLSLNTLHLFLIAGIVMFGQVLALLTHKDSIHSWGLFAFFLADALLANVLVRSTGASASPFLVVYPLIALAGAVVFTEPLKPILLSAAAILAMIHSIGFGVAIVGNAIAVIATSALGFYLMRALNVSGKALQQSEGARKRLENLQKAILANIPSGLMSVDAEGRIIQVNRVGLKILSRTENDVLNKKLSQVLPALDPQLLKLNTLVPTIQSSENQRDRRTVSYKNPRGEELSLGYSIARLNDPVDRGPLGTLVVFQDLTDFMKLEENLRVSEKLAAVGKLAAGIAHEIRNPLAGISGSAQLLLGHDDLDDEDKRLLAIIQRESMRLDSLITDFLEYVRPPKGKMDKVNLQLLCEQALENVKVNPKWAAMGARLEFKFSGQGPVMVNGDSNRITQVLLNLIFNAGQAGAKNVELALRENPSNQVAPQISVSDDGSGISPEHQNRLFEPFFTTKEGGTGLGLAISYKLLEAMGARIHVRSPATEFTPKGGTIFSIDFEKGKP